MFLKCEGQNWQSWHLVISSRLSRHIRAVPVLMHGATFSCHCGHQQKLPIFVGKLVIFRNLDTKNATEKEILLYLAKHEIANVGKVLSLKVGKVPKCYYRFATISNLCNSPKALK